MGGGVEGRIIHEYKAINPPPLTVFGRDFILMELARGRLGDYNNVETV